MLGANEILRSTKKTFFFQRSTNETLATDIMLIFTFTSKYMS